MTQTILIIIGIAIVSFIIGRKSKKTLTPKEIEKHYFPKSTDDELNEMRKGAREAINERTADRKEKVLDYIKKETAHEKALENCNVEEYAPGVTCKEIEKLLDVSDDTARKYLNELESEDKIKQIGERGKNVYYILNLHTNLA